MRQLKTKGFVINTVILPLAIFAFWALIAYFSPMTQDDRQFWSYRIVGFENVLKHIVSYGNGRLLGNFGVFYLIEYTPLRVLVKAAFFTGLSLLLPRALDLKGRFYILASFLLVSLCAPKMFAQVITWTCGFHNYVPCIVLTLAVIRLCKLRKHSLLLSIPVFLLSFAAQLYVEHSSAVNVLTAIALLLYAAKADKKMLPSSIAFVLGTVLGLALMLAIPRIVPNLQEDMEVFKTTTFSLGIGGMIATMLKQSLVLLARFSENVLLVSALSFSVCMLLGRYEMQLKKHEKNVLYFALLLPCALMDLAQLNSMGNLFGDAALYETLLLAALCGIWLAALCWSLVRLGFIMRDKKMQLALVLLLLALVSVAPLLLISPMPIRMAFHCYVFFSALLLQLLSIALEEKHIRTGEKALALTALISCLWLTVHFADINRLSNMRDDYIEEAVNNGQTAVEFFVVPSDYVFTYYTDEIYSWYYDALYSTDVKLDLVSDVMWMEENK